MNGRIWTIALAIALASPLCGAQIIIRGAPDASAKPYSFHDGHFHVSFQVPPGWKFTTKDGEVSTFHADVMSAPRRSAIRGVASLDFNPYPFSTLSGAMFYFSVNKNSSAQECAGQAGPASGSQEIGGMNFAHGHDEHGDICTEARDDVYTAYRKGACFRFDLEINTFCAASSGAQEITDEQLQDIERRMTGILSTVELGWEKSGPNFVPVPALPASLYGPAIPAQPSSRTPAPESQTTNPPPSDFQRQDFR